MTFIGSRPTVLPASFSRTASRSDHETPTRSQLQKTAWSLSVLTAMAVTHSGFSTYSEMRSANWPTRDTFLSGVREYSAQPI